MSNESTEIAQSRERFEKRAEFYPLDDPDGYEFELFASGRYKLLELQMLWEIHQAAERDTRERCAQSTVEYLKSRGITMTNKEWDELAERIRGEV